MRTIVFILVLIAFAAQTDSCFAQHRLPRLPVVSLNQLMSSAAKMTPLGGLPRWSMATITGVGKNLFLTTGGKEFAVKKSTGTLKENNLQLLPMVNRYSITSLAKRFEKTIDTKVNLRIQGTNMLSLRKNGL